MLFQKFFRLILSICVLLALPFAASIAQDPPSQPPTIILAEVNTAIIPLTQEYLESAIAHSEAQNAEALLITLDTPGGLLEATRKIVQSMLQSQVPIIVYVSPAGARAGSAGVFITMAGHVAAMAPTTNIGAAHPVTQGGDAPEGEMGKKVTNDAVAWARGIAETRNRNADWAESAVRESASIPATDALNNNVIDIISPDITTLLNDIDGREIMVGDQKVTLRTRNATIVPFEMNLRQKVVSFLANPNLTYILLLVGLLGLFIEFQSPGLIVPGVLGALSLGIVLGVQVLPVNWLGVVLILGAAAFLIAEIYVTSFGILSAIGLTSLVIGSFLLFDVPGSTFQVEPALIWAVAVLFAALILGMGSILLRMHRQKATSGPEGMANEEGIVYERIAPGEPGRIRFRGHFWIAESDEPLEPNTKVSVIKVEGLRVQVRRKI